MQQNRKPEGRVRRIMRQTALGLGGLVILLAASGALYNTLELHRLRAAYPPPGKIYAVDGHAMHLYCLGAGSPTVVLESGRAESFLVWGKVQPALSRTTRVCSYDRAGLGWSEATEGPRDSEHIASQLHGLLAKAGIDGPLVLLGHSAGGLYIRGYRARYPDQVQGLVFVDATMPEKTPPHLAAIVHHEGLEVTIFQMAIALGIPRLLGDCSTPPPGFDATVNLWRADACKPSYVTAYKAESKAWPLAVSEVERAESLDDLPIVVLSRDTHLPPPHNLAAAVPRTELEQDGRNHDAAQEALVHLSSRGRRIIAQGSSHYIHFDRPALVVREARSLVQSLRTGRDQPGLGTTITQ